MSRLVDGIGGPVQPLALDRPTTVWLGGEEIGGCGSAALFRDELDRPSIPAPGERHQQFVDAGIHGRPAFRQQSPGPLLRSRYAAQDLQIGADPLEERRDPRRFLGYRVASSVGEVGALQKPPGRRVLAVSWRSLSAVTPDGQGCVETLTLRLYPRGHVGSGREFTQPVDGGLDVVVPPILPVASRDP